MSVTARIGAVIRAAWPVDPGFAAALARRWAELPETARTPGQVLGRHAVGCEGTHGVFPRCNLACTPATTPATQTRSGSTAHTPSPRSGRMRLLRDRPPPRLARPGPHRPPPAALPAPRDRPGPAMAGLLARHPSYLRRGAGPRAPVHPAGGRHPSARCRRHHGPRRGTPALATAQPR